MICRECKDRDDVPHADLVGAPGRCEICRSSVDWDLRTDSFGDIPIGGPTGALRQGNESRLREEIAAGQQLVREHRELARAIPVNVSLEAQRSEPG